jgi:hypothetical protein
MLLTMGAEQLSRTERLTEWRLPSLEPAEAVTDEEAEQLSRSILTPPKPPIAYVPVLVRPASLYKCRVFLLHRTR